MHTFRLLAALILGQYLLLFGAGCHSTSVSHSSQPATKTESKGFSDLHNSVLYRLLASGNLAGLDDDEAAVSIQAIHEVNAKVMVLSIGVPRFDMVHGDTTTIEDVLKLLRDFRTKVEEDYPRLALVGDGKDLRTALEQGKTAVTFALEGSWLLERNDLESSLSLLDSLHVLRVRTIGVAHRFHNTFIVPPVRAEEVFPGGPSFLRAESRLSESGEALVRRMIQLGMRIDVSHLPEKAFWQVVKINAGQTPLVASHSNAHVLCPVVRNLTKEQIKAIADTEGLIGLCFHQKMLCGDNPTSGTAELVDHIVYMLEVAGEDRVALGSDLEGLISPAKDLAKLNQVSAIRNEMERRGISSATIAKVMWKNALQIF